MRCLACEEQNLTQIYEPRGTLRNAKVLVCEYCHLIQSSTSKADGLVRTLSSDAEWGNVRHAKPLRLDATQNLIAAKLNAIPNEGEILDVGSSRGHFERFVADNFPMLRYVGVENDKSVIPTNSNSRNVSIEEFLAQKPNVQFDFVFMNHTLEHLNDPISSLISLRQLIKSEGILWVDVPNIKAIEEPLAIEEFFIDKHVTHFSPQSLGNTLRIAGWEVAEDYSDAINLTVVAMSSSNHYPRVAMNSVNPLERVAIEQKIATYAANLVQNRTMLSSVSAMLKQLDGPVALFGAGRVLDALIRFGDLAPEEFQVCDNYLKHASGILGTSILEPSEIRWSKIKSCVILGRSSSAAISAQLTKSLGFKGEIYEFSDFMRIARGMS